MDFIATKLICLSKPYRRHFHHKSLKYSTFPGYLSMGYIGLATRLRMKVRDLDELFQPLENDEFLPNQPAQDEQPLQAQQENRMRDHNSTQPHCLFQMMVYNIHSVVKKTPLHMMLGHALYAIGLYRQNVIAIQNEGDDSIRVMCTTSQCRLRYPFQNLRVTTVFFIVTYYTLPRIESSPSFWMT